ncbi:MAG: hypothetical protein ABI718_15305 [Acidobacteriota bacterium]
MGFELMDVRVPMMEQTVDLALPGSEPEEHVIFLAPASDRVLSETLEEYLQGPRQFLPMSSSGIPKIVNKEHILWVRVTSDPRGEPEELTLIKETILELVDGSRLEGYVRIGAPLIHPRVSDLMNQPGDLFIRLEDSGAIYYINKMMVRFALPR